MDTKKSTMATPTLETFADQTQVFASAWSLINRQFGGEDSLERAEVERGILLDMARRLIEDHDAARQEIASLKAQPYDQQAMGLCHICGWKGVIDYPGGPVCVACEHDKALSPQPTAQPLHVAATSCPHEIDKDKIVLHFDSKQPGKNALAQLSARLQAAQALDARWVSAKDRLPDPFCEVLVHPRPTDYCCEGSVNTQGEWSYGEYEHHFGHNSIKCNVTHWMPLPTPPVAIATKQGGQ